MNPIHEAEAMDEVSCDGGLMQRLRTRVAIMARSSDEQIRSESAALEAILLEELAGRTVPDLSWSRAPGISPKRRRIRNRAAEPKRRDWWSVWKVTGDL